MIIFFNSAKRNVHHKKEEYCVVKYNKNGLFSMEYYLLSSVGKFEVLEDYIYEYKGTDLL